MSEDDAALFWGVDTPTNPVSEETSADPALDSTEAMPVEGLCLRAMTLPTPVVTTNAPAIKDSTMKIAPAKTVQDTKPAVQSQATNTVDVDEIQGDEIAILRLHQVTTDTQTES